MDAFTKSFDREFGAQAKLSAANVTNPRQFEIKTPNAVLRVDADRSDLVETREIDGHTYVMLLDWFEFERDGKEIPRIHPTQKPVRLLKRLISIFTDPGDVVIDCCAGSGSTLRAAWELGRRAYGFEVDRRFFTDAVEQMLAPAFVSQPDCT